MELTGTCQVCQQNGGCGCKSDLARFFMLLQQTHSRVSSQKPTSDNTAKTPSAALIDKLIFTPIHPLPEEQVINNLRQSRLSFRKIRHRDHRWCYEITPNQTGTYLRIWSGPNPTINEIVTRASSFTSYSDYLRHLHAFLTSEQILTAAIKRIDLAIDYKLDFKTVLCGFDFKQKQLQVQFLDKGANRTGLRVGKGNEVIQVYDKSVESDLQTSLTRIEFQLKGQKLPCQSIHDLPLKIEASNLHFNLITLNDVRAINSLSLNKQQQNKLNEFESIVRREGYFSARRVPNQNGNFLRDYGPTFKLEPWPEQPQESFKRLIANFFNPTKGETHGTH